MLETEIKKLTAAVTELTSTIANQTGTKPAAAAASNVPTDASAGVGQAKAAAPKKGTDKSADAAAAATAAATSEPTVDDSATVPTPEVESTVAVVPTKKELVDKFIELAQKKDREVAVALLAKFGVSTLPELKDKAQWPAFVAAIEELLA